MQTTKLLEIIEALNAASSKTELARLKRFYGEDVIAEAWEYLSDAAKARIHSIAKKQSK